MIAAGAGVVVLLLLIVMIASAGGGDERPTATPVDLGVPTTPARRDRDRDERTRTERTETDSSPATPVTPPPVDYGSEPLDGGDGSVPPSTGEGGGATPGGEQPAEPAPPESGEGGGAVAPSGE